MSARALRGLLFGLGLVVLFAAVVAILLHFLPGPLTNTDYLVAGCAATFVVLLVLFVVIGAAWARTGELLGRRKR